jgi:hypothetical protein
MASETAAAMSKGTMLAPVKKGTMLAPVKKGTMLAPVKKGTMLASVKKAKRVERPQYEAAPRTKGQRMIPRAIARERGTPTAP